MDAREIRRLKSCRCVAPILFVLLLICIVVSTSVGDLFRFTEPAHRNALHQCIHRIGLSFKHSRYHGCLDDAGADGVEPASLGGVFEPRALGQTNYAVLRGMINPAFRDTDQSTKRSRRLLPGKSG